MDEDGRGRDMNRPSTENGNMFAFVVTFMRSFSGFARTAIHLAAPSWLRVCELLICTSRTVYGVANLDSLESTWV